MRKYNSKIWGVKMAEKKEVEEENDEEDDEEENYEDW